MARRSEASEKPADPDARAIAAGDVASASAPVERGHESARPPAPHAKQKVEAAAPSGAAGSRDAEPSPWWLRRGDQAVLAVLCAVCLVLMGWYQLRLSGWGRRPIEIRNLPQRQVDYRIDINRASWVEFAQLPRIGRTLAERIVEDRERNGPFSSIDDLQRVRGIGAKTIDRIRPLLKPIRANALHEAGESQDAQTVPGKGQSGVQ